MLKSPDLRAFFNVTILYCIAIFYYKLSQNCPRDTGSNLKIERGKVSFVFIWILKKEHHNVGYVFLNS